MSTATTAPTSHNARPIAFLIAAMLVLGLLAAVAVYATTGSTAPPTPLHNGSNAFPCRVGHPC